MKRKLLIIVIALSIVIILLLNSFSERNSNKYLGSIPVLMFEMQKQKDRIEIKLNECSTKKCNDALKEKLNEINNKYSDDIFKNEFEKVKNKEILYEVSEGLPIKVILSPKFTSINENQCLTLKCVLMATEDIKIDTNNNLLYIKYLDKKGKVIDATVNKYILTNQNENKISIMAGEEIDINSLECIDPKKAKRWIYFEKIAFITENEYNKIKNKLFD
jgi:hypothetical protein